MGHHDTIESCDGAYNVPYSAGRDRGLAESYKRGGGALSMFCHDTNYERETGWETNSV